MKHDKDKMIRLISTICEMNKDYDPDSCTFTKTLREILYSDSSGSEKSRQLFEPLMAMFSYQGIGDTVVDSYRKEHGDITYLQISRKLNKFKEENGKLCSKLQSFSSFQGCGYNKSSQTCNNQIMFSRCPLPTHDLLKGILNQKAYSFYLFIKDECNGDLIEYIDNIINSYVKDLSTEAIPFVSITNGREELISRLTRIGGVGRKLSNMSFSDLLTANGKNLKWVAVGSSMIAIDRLVHNFLYRTGFLRAFGTEHQCGSACAEKCVSVIYSLAESVNASTFNPRFPEFFPRFIEFSIWKYCAEHGFNICNGRNIDDTKPCEMGKKCNVSDLCARIPLSA